MRMCLARGDAACVRSGEFCGITALPSCSTSGSKRAPQHYAFSKKKKMTATMILHPIMLLGPSVGAIQGNHRRAGKFLNGVASPTPKKKRPSAAVATALWDATPSGRSAAQSANNHPAPPAVGVRFRRRGRRRGDTNRYPSTSPEFVWNVLLVRAARGRFFFCGWRRPFLPFGQTYGGKRKKIIYFYFFCVDECCCGMPLPIKSAQL